MNLIEFGHSSVVDLFVGILELISFCFHFLVVCFCQYFAVDL